MISSIVSMFASVTGGKKARSPGRLAAQALLLYAVVATLAAVWLGYIAWQRPAGVVPSAEPRQESGDEAPLAGDEPAVRSHLYAFDVRSVPIAKRASSGGAIGILEDNLLVAMPQGRLALVRDDGDVEWLSASVPMNLAGFHEWDVANPDPEGEKWTHNRWPFRVADILPKQVAPDRWELFATHHYFAEDCIRFRLSSTMIERETAGRADGFTASSPWRTVFDAEPCLDFPHHGQQAGGRMSMDGAGRLLVVIGDHGRDGWDSEALGRSPILPQDARSHFGKLVSVDVVSGQARILASGLRNPQGLARDRDGRLWAAEHGPRGGDELNVLEEGMNYGWPGVTYGLTYGQTVPRNIDAAKAGMHEGFALPAYSWIPSVGVSAVAVNDENRLPLWKDDILVGSLTGTSLFRIRRTESRAIYAERLEFDWGIRDIAIMPDGRIALMDDSITVHFLSISREPCDDNANELYPRGHLYTLRCGELAAGAGGGAPRAAAAPVAPPGAGDLASDADDGATLFANHCAQCHRARSREHGVGPHLVDVIGRRAGTVAGYDYSAAFDTLSRTWTKESLMAFLTAPEESAPGSRMPDTGVSEAQAREIVEFLDDGE